MIYFPNSKINIGLNIISKRNDGFHNIETILYPLSLCDILEVRPKQIGNTSLEVSNMIIEDENLCLKAYNLLKKNYPYLPEVSIHLIKNIPSQAGLGGGSSDAAFTLKLLNSECELNLSELELEKFARELGSDCAFFIYNIPCYAYEKGDKFYNTTLSLRGKTILLVKPNISISTAEAYSEVVAQKTEYNLLNIVENLPIAQWRHFIKNDFEKTLFKKYKELELIKDKMYEIGALYAQMSGSGSTIYGLFDRDLTPDEINLFDYPFVCNRILK
jgi:4-diphosphocytidyl-2-C-methyl-D-erythritol kinase